MPTRIVSFILAVAIFACPLWCGQGLCHAECCGFVPLQALEEAPPQDPACSCCHTAHGDSDRCPAEQTDEKPHKSPRQSSCQGVCGGAVVEKRIEWNDATVALTAPLIATELPVVDGAGEFTPRFHGRHGCLRRKNLGRMLRTLHMSFLC